MEQQGGDSHGQEVDESDLRHESKRRRATVNRRRQIRAFSPRIGVFGELARFHDASPGADTANGTSAALSTLQLVACRTSSS